MNILGVSAGFHDAGLAVITTQGDIVYASHSERYSGRKNDENLHLQQICEAAAGRSIAHIAYYERPWKKQLRQVYSGQGIEWSRLTTGQILRQQLQGHFEGVPYSSHGHHLSHAAGGFQTSPFDRATVVVIDAIGEWDTVTIWAAEYRSGRAHYRRLWRQRYPHSIGLFYTAMTDRVGLRPMEEEYITMGMAAFGRNAEHTALGMQADLIQDLDTVTFSQNLHAGVAANFMWSSEPEDIAAGAQHLVEDLIMAVMRRARAFGFSNNLVYSGGVALNCRANRLLGTVFDQIWVMPNPGDAGSSLGAAALAHGGRLNWRNAYLGTEIAGAYPVADCLHSLITQGLCGVASGRAEWGPRSLGNRSLLADPRGSAIKERVNAIKQRQQFRPFAPAILAEHVLDYFDMPSGWVDTGYMQVTGLCRRPDLFPAIVHVDGTSRVQTVPADGSGFRQLLEAWYERTGCPMLLNTSLNIRGRPQVNTRADAEEWQETYGVAVHS
jgi:carbamoyltransferase